jgi:hypothetical protein
MALILDKELPSGVVASYHRILRFTVDYQPMNPEVREPVVTVEIGEYVDGNVRAAGKWPIRTETKAFALSDWAGADPRKLLYAELAQPVEYTQVPIPEHLKNDPATLSNPYYQTKVPKRPALGYEGAASDVPAEKPKGLKK